MKDLKCGLKDCRFNKGYCCCAECICVDEKTDCTSYEQDETKVDNTFEAAEDFAPADFSVDTRVACTARCLFNKDNRCIANGITVMSDTNDEAVCLTFVKE